MAVAFDASSESHTGTTGSVSQTSFSWTHTPAGTPKGVLVYTFSNCDASTADVATGVSYGGRALVPVSGGRAVDTATEPGDCKAWFVSGHTSGVAGGWVNSASTNVGNVVAYGNGYWVAVSGSAIRYATDPLGTWTTAATQSVSSVAYGDGYWVATGSGGIFYATDPTGTWTQASSSTDVTQGVAFGKDASNNNIWVAVGTTVRYATDPTGTWSAATSSGISAGENLTDVAFGKDASNNNIWVATGNNGKLRYANDPTGTWSATSSFWGTAGISYGVAYGNGYWVVVGDGSRSPKYTTDPTGTWSTGAGFGTGDYNSVTYGNGQWVAVGGSTVTSSFGRVRYTNDLTVSWSAAITTTTTATQTYNSVAYGNGQWVAASSGIMLVASEFPVSLSSGAKTVTVYRTNTTDEMYAVAITVTADYEVETTGVSAVSADASGGTVALAGTSISDGSPGTKSMRFAGVNSGLSAPPTVNSGTTAVADIDYGTRVVAVARETSASEGSTSIGWTASADDVAAVYLAIREAIVPWTVGIPIR